MVFVFDSNLDLYKTGEIRGRVVFEDPFLIVYCPDECQTQKMCDKAVDDSLVALKFILDLFVTIKIIKELLRTFYCFVGRWKYTQV